MVLSARDTISRNCCLRIVRLIDASPFDAIASLLGSNRRPIESNRHRKMKDLAFFCRGPEGDRIEIGRKLLRMSGGAAVKAAGGVRGVTRSAPNEVEEDRGYAPPAP